jgi:adenylate cyclase
LPTRGVGLSLAIPAVVTESDLNSRGNGQECMSTYNANVFGDTVMRDFTARRQGVEVKAMAKAAHLETRSLGHPDFEGLAIGQRRAAPLACVFLDLTDFSGRTFWDDETEVVDLAHSVLTGFIEVVSAFGGYPLGLRGGGVFAGFGPGKASIDSTCALAACSFALDAVEHGLNPRLIAQGIEPVKARAGVDYGSITFVRSGSGERSEVNPLGFAANFAAKSEKKAKSWEVVVGEGIAVVLPDADTFTEHADSPKTYQRNYQRRAYKFYDYRWRALLPHLPEVIRQINGHPTTAIQMS